MEKVYVFSKLENGQIHREEIELTGIDIIMQDEINYRTMRYLIDKYPVNYGNVKWLIKKLLLINPTNHSIKNDAEGIIIHSLEYHKNLEESFEYMTEFNSELLHL